MRHQRNLLQTPSGNYPKRGSSDHFCFSSSLFLRKKNMESSTDYSFWPTLTGNLQAYSSEWNSKERQDIPPTKVKGKGDPQKSVASLREAFQTLVMNPTSSTALKWCSKKGINGRESLKSNCIWTFNYVPPNSCFGEESWQVLLDFYSCADRRGGEETILRWRTPNYEKNANCQ